MNRPYSLIKKINTTILLIVLSLGATLITITFIKEIKSFHKESKQIRTNFIQQQKTILKTEVRRITNRINYRNKKTSLNFEKQYIFKNFLNFLNTYRFGENKNNYIFILELLDINGGKKFAKMFFNPNRKGIIGKYLSDEYKDAKGKQFRKEFLKGLRKDGECFVEYWYKKIDNPKPSPKLSFFKLTSDKKYIIASGVYLDTIESKIDLLQKTAKKDTIVQIITIIGFIIFLIAIFFILSKILINYMKKDINLFIKSFENATNNNQKINKDDIRFTETISLINNVNKILQEKVIIEDKLIKSENKFTNFFKKSKNAHLLIIENQFIDCNQAAIDLLGYSKEELLNKPQNLSPNFQVNGKASESEALKHTNLAISKGWDRFEWIHLHKDGSPRFIDVTLTSIERDNQIVIFTSWYDITKRKEAESILKNKLIEIENINKKLESYSYTISHDLKEPIRSIRTFSEFILEDYEKQFDDEAKDYFSRIIKASTKMALMIDDLLILSKIGRTDIAFKENSISKIIENVKDTLAQKIEQTNTIINDNNLPAITCQKVWINAVFQNLISNSIKYGDKEKTIIEISYKELDNFHEFTIKDNGKGIKKDQHEKIFGLFRKAHQDKNIEGSGAGLAIVSSVIEQHNGKIWIEWSEIDKGTVVKFTISKKLTT